MPLPPIKTIGPKKVFRHNRSLGFVHKNMLHISAHKSSQYMAEKDERPNSQEEGLMTFTFQTMYIISLLPSQIQYKTLLDKVYWSAQVKIVQPELWYM